MEDESDIVVERKRPWVWFSSVNSAGEGKPSVLAVFETIGALTVSIYLLMFGFTVHLVASACFAPFLLMRTEEVTIFSLRIMNRLGDNFDVVMDVYFRVFERVSVPLGYIVTVVVVLFIIMSELNNMLILPVLVILFFLYVFSFFLLILLLVLVYILAMLCINILSVCVCVFRAPIEMLRAIPINLWRNCTAMDVFHPFEVVSGARYLEESGAFDRLSMNCTLIDSVMIFSAIKKGVRGSVVKKVAGFFFAGPMVIGFVFLILGPSFLYRLSLKASVFIYLPLVWVLHNTLTENWTKKVKDIVKHPFQQFRRYLGLLIAGVIVVKSIFIVGAISAQQNLSDNALRLYNTYVAPTEIPIWQIASLINVAITWIVFWIAWSIMLHREENVDDSENPLFLVSVIRGLWGVSAVLTLYTTAILIYNAFTMHWHLPPIGSKLFPW